MRAPILAEASMPRVMAPGDRSTVTVDVQNFTGKQGKFAVKVEGVGPLVVAEAGRSVTLGIDGKTTLNFPLRALEEIAWRKCGCGWRVMAQGGAPL